MKWTDPSQKAVLTPPGWLLVGGMASIGPPVKTSHEFEAVQPNLLGVCQ